MLDLTLSNDFHGDFLAWLSWNQDKEFLINKQADLYSTMEFRWIFFMLSLELGLVVLLLNWHHLEFEITCWYRKGRREKV